MASTLKKKLRFAYEPDFVTEPGSILRETIDSLGITQKELAARTGYSPKHVNQLIGGKARITPEAAFRLERVTRVPARFWNNLETQYRDRKARLEANLTVAEDLLWMKTIPTRELIKRGFLPSNANPAETLAATLSFFGVASVDAWKAGWSKHRIAFRKSDGADECSGGIAAWVRLAELQAAKLECATYHSASFKAALDKIRRLTTVSPEKFVPEMRQICAAAGVALSLVPDIPGTKVSGAARWLNNSNAMIALNLRGKRNDKFWFTFFHEAGHILNDSPDEVFVDVDYDEDPREQAANKFAKDLLISPSHARELKTLKSKAAVRTYAQRIGIHAGIVVGRLQHEKIIPFSHMHELMERLDWKEA